jgi:uncharacterized protein YjbI with pentapeptide repeats
MANPEHLKILKQGIEVWNNAIEQRFLINPDLSSANLIAEDLSNAALVAANLRGADLSNANLTSANLIGADLSYANLRRTNLSDAVLFDANLTYAKLIGAKLNGAILISANCTGVNLSNAELRGAALSSTVLVNANLTNVKDLAFCKHSGPSYLDYHTLTRSGTLPVNFLRACGLSDEFIELLPSLFSHPIQYYSCFISYATRDQEFADRLYADLQNNGVRCWCAPYDIQGGKKIHEQIHEAIRNNERLLLILSEASMDSEWVKTEITNASTERDQGKPSRALPDCPG